MGLFTNKSGDGPSKFANLISGALGGVTEAGVNEFFQTAEGKRIKKEAIQDFIMKWWPVILTLVLFTIYGIYCFIKWLLNKNK